MKCVLTTLKFLWKWNCKECENNFTSHRRNKKHLQWKGTFSEGSAGSINRKDCSKWWANGNEEYLSVLYSFLNKCLKPPTFNALNILPQLAVKCLVIQGNVNKARATDWRCHRKFLNLYFGTFLEVKGNIDSKQIFLKLCFAPECPERQKNSSKQNNLNKLKFWKNMSPIWRALCAAHLCFTLGLNMLNFMFHIHIQMKNENEMRKYMLRMLKCENGYFKDHLFSLWFAITNPGLILWRQSTRWMMKLRN